MILLDNRAKMFKKLTLRKPIGQNYFKSYSKNIICAKIFEKITLRTLKTLNEIENR